MLTVLAATSLNTHTHAAALGTHQRRGPASPVIIPMYPVFARCLPSRQTPQARRRLRPRVWPSQGPHRIFPLEHDVCHQPGQPLGAASTVLVSVRASVDKSQAVAASSRSTITCRRQSRLLIQLSLRFPTPPLSKQLAVDSGPHTRDLESLNWLAPPSTLVPLRASLDFGEVLLARPGVAFSGVHD